MSKSPQLLAIPTGRVLIDAEFFDYEHGGLLSCRFLALIPDTRDDMWVVFQTIEETGDPVVHAIHMGSRFYNGFEEEHK